MSRRLIISSTVRRHIQYKQAETRDKVPLLLLISAIYGAVVLVRTGEVEKTLSPLASSSRGLRITIYTRGAILCEYSSTSTVQQERLQYELAYSLDYTRARLFCGCRGTWVYRYDAVVHERHFTTFY